MGRASYQRITNFRIGGNQKLVNNDKLARRKKNPARLHPSRSSPQLKVVTSDRPRKPILSVKSL